MKSKERRPAAGETEKNALVFRLERNQEHVDRLRDQLTSYLYEPKTPGLFERREGLRDGLEDLTRTNTETIASLREKKRLVGPYVEKAERQLAKFILLHGSMEEYVQGVMVTQRALEQTS